ncbi:hypothetical protein BDZ94DRAFT_1233929 [Collybia nuda]|uniref:Uncharacterized protein n=1 Tax=Collybia nuda TaxID=64659 RepID=A0A9P5YD68_9AGAR|nr:hypothetical protein BDZ94DRAFT_1233929 [Collybia nuda]
MYILPTETPFVTPAFRGPRHVISVHDPPPYETVFHFWPVIHGCPVMAMGYVLMKATTPTEEQLYNEMAPDIRRKVDAARAARLAREAEMQKQVSAQTSNDVNPETTKPIWADTPPTSK